MEKIKIPSSYKVGGQTVKVNIKESLSGKLGVCCLGAGYIDLARTFDEGRENQSPTSMLNTFLHELTHSILDTMGKEELSKDESFVCTFSSFLTEALLSMEYEEGKKDEK